MAKLSLIVFLLGVTLISIKATGGKFKHAELQRLFKSYDKSGDGKICKSELKSALKSLTDKDAEELIDQVDGNDDDELDFDEFVKFMAKYGGEARKNDLKASFDLYDKDKSGSICKNELKVALPELTGKTYTDADIDEMVKEVDTDGSGHISFEEFCNMLN